MTVAAKKPNRRQCTGKHPHTRAKAIAHLVSLRKKDGAFGMQAYKCKVCKAWHVGHRPRNRRRRL